MSKRCTKLHNVSKVLHLMHLGLEQCTKLHDVSKVVHLGLEHCTKLHDVSEVVHTSGTDLGTTTQNCTGCAPRLETLHEIAQTSCIRAARTLEQLHKTSLRSCTFVWNIAQNCTDISEVVHPSGTDLGTTAQKCTKHLRCRANKWHRP